MVIPIFMFAGDQAEKLLVEKVYLAESAHDQPATHILTQAIQSKK